MNMFKDSGFKTPKEYFDSLDEPRRTELKTLDALIRKTIPAQKPYMQIGMPSYGSYHYKYASGKEGDWGLVMLASRKNYISLYICATDGKQYVPEKHKRELPKVKIGKSCINIKKLEDIDLNVVVAMLKEAESWLKKQK